MKKKWIRTFCLVSMVLFLWIAPVMGLQIADLTVSDTYITVGESFDLTVSLYTDPTLGYGDLSSFGFDVYLDTPTPLFSYDGYAIGTDFIDASDISNPLNVNGWYDFFTGTNPQPSTLSLATLSFTALGVGTEAIEIEGIYNMIDGLVYMLTEDDIFGSIDVTVNEHVIPEPSTMLLLGAGLLGLGGVMRKKK